MQPTKLEITLTVPLITAFMQPTKFEITLTVPLITAFMQPTKGKLNKNKREKYGKLLYFSF